MEIDRRVHVISKSAYGSVWACHHCCCVVYIMLIVEDNDEQIEWTDESTLAVFVAMRQHQSL